MATAEKTYFIENLSLLISSGMGVSDGVVALQEDIKSKAFKKTLARVEEDLQNGMTLWQALQKSNVLDTRGISLIKIGEESGKLSQNLKVIALQENKNRIFKSKIRSAILYPALVVSITIIVGIGISWFILPKLGTIFAQLRVPLPLITKGLIAFGLFIGKYGAIVIPAFLALMGLCLYLFFVNEKTKFIGQNILFVIPGARNLVQELELSRFGFLLGTLLSAGLPLVDALDSIAGATSFVSYRKFYANLRDSIEEGNSFEKSFALFKGSRDFVPLPLQQMIVAGEQSGKLADALLTIGQNFEEKSEITSKNLSVVLEPILLVVVWVGVVFVALSVVLPIYSLIGSINQ